MKLIERPSTTPTAKFERRIPMAGKSIVQVRREAVDAVTRQRGLERRAGRAVARAVELERLALLSLDKGNVRLTRKILTDRVETLKRHADILDELRSATDRARQIKNDLRRLESRAAAPTIGESR